MPACAKAAADACLLGGLPAEALAQAGGGKINLASAGFGEGLFHALAVT